MTAFTSLGALPPLSRQALELRVRLALAFMEERDLDKSIRLIRLVERAHNRFERREAQARAHEVRQ